MGQYFDERETRSHEERERAHFAKMPEIVRSAMQLGGWAKHLAGIEPLEITSRQALARLPVLRKTELSELQVEHPPFGDFAVTDVTAFARIFTSPGPIFEPQCAEDDWRRVARALYAAGFRAGDIVLNTFSYHLTPGGWIIDSGARALGCVVIPAGPANTELQVEAIRHLRPTGYVGVPDFLKILLESLGDNSDGKAHSFEKALVSGGALFPSLREEYENAGISCRQCYATADVWPIAYETEVDGHLCEGMIVDEGVIVEIVRPGTGVPVEPGEVGEVVVTSFNRGYPMIRLATGDLSCEVEGASPCGRTNMRIKGWMGRADQATKIKGMFVRPEQLAAVAERHRELGRLRLVVTREDERDIMTLKAECSDVRSGLADEIATTLREITKMRGEVELVPSKSLPNDGIVVADERDYD